MSTPLLPDATALPPKDRVIQAGLLLLRSWGRLPTQDEVVAALRVPDGKSTAKATVNKYWPAYQAALARELRLGDWLPPEIPEFVNDHLRALLDWARQEAERRLQDQQRVLEARRQRFENEEDALKQAIYELNSTVKTLDTDRSRLSDQVETLSKDRDHWQRRCSEAEHQRALSEVRGGHLEDSLASERAAQMELKQQMGQLKQSFEAVRNERDQYGKDLAQLTAQHQTLQAEHREVLAKLARNSTEVEALTETRASLIAANTDLKRQLGDARDATHQADRSRERLEAQASRAPELEAQLQAVRERNTALERENALLQGQFRLMSEADPGSESA